MMGQSRQRRRHGKGKNGALLLKMETMWVGVLQMGWYLGQRRQCGP